MRLRMHYFVTPYQQQSMRKIIVNLMNPIIFIDVHDGITFNFATQTRAHAKACIHELNEKEGNHERVTNS